MARGDARAATYMMPGLFVNMLLGATLFGLAIRLVTDREMGVLRRYRVTPVPALCVVLSHGLTALLTPLVTFFLLWGVGRAAFKVTVAGSPVTLILTFVCGVVALLPLGLLVGSIARDSRSAPALANILFFPMLFLSGATFPFAFLPDGVQRFARLLPATYAVEALQAVMVRGDSLRTVAPRLLVLLALAAVGIGLSALLFRWEGTEPVSRRSLAMVAAGFAVVLGGAALLSPAFGMGRAPWQRTPTAGRAKGQVRVLRGMTLLDGLGGRFENARVVIRDHCVTEITADSAAATPAGAVVDDLSGRFLIPGLIDSHIHLGASGGIGGAPLEYSPAREIRDTQALLGVGVTSVVSLTDDLRDMRVLRESVAMGEMRAPRMFFAGPSITAPGGHPSELFSFSRALQERLTRQVTTAAEAESAVAELASSYVDIVKLALEGGSWEHALPKLSPEALRAAVAAAHEAGLKTTVHIGSDADAQLAAEAGADGLEHVPFDLSDETIRLLALKKVTLTPTLGILDLEFKRSVATGQDELTRAWADPATLTSIQTPARFLQLMLGDADRVAAIEHRLAAQADATERAARGGVVILAGSDSGNPGLFHGPALVHEMEILVERAHLTPDEVLLAATSRAADRLGHKDLGRIAPGSVADLVVLDRDPSADIRALRAVRAVYLGGLPLDRQTLLTTSPGSWVPGHN